ncbi:MAG TPA: ferredoxin--NADP reductase [Casimicrobiaceae bacterium]|nr:ferredoxin--NADP reductase [Casimicrobiaceae bacterium]
MPDGTPPPRDDVGSGPAVTPAAASWSKATRETVVAVRRWTDSLVSIRVTRDPGYRFVAGRYARLGLSGSDGSAVVRPLSIASATSEPHLDFLCTLVPGGEFSSLVEGCAAGDDAYVERASFGFLTVDALAPGSDLWLVASGTGIAPFLSILREDGVWSTFERIVVVHSVRVAAELAPAQDVARLDGQPAAPGAARLRYLPVVTREPGAAALASRIPALIEDGRLEAAAGVPIDARRSRVMTCGNPALAQDVRRLLAARGFQPTRRNAPGQMAFENYWQPPRTAAFAPPPPATSSLPLPPRGHLR